MTSTEGAAGARRQASALTATFRALTALAPGRRGITAVLVSLGIVGAIAESLGITMIVLLLHLSVGSDSAGLQMGGLLGSVIERLHGAFGTNNATLAGVIFLLICLQAVLAAVYQIQSDKVGYRMSEAVRNAIHQRLLFIPFDRFLSHERGELLNTLATHSFSVSSAYNALVRLAVSVGTVLVFSAFLLAASWQIALMALGGYVLLAVLARQFARISRAFGEQMAAVNQDLSTVMLKTLQGMRTIRSFGREGQQQQRLEQVSRQQLDATLRFTFLHNLLSPVTEIGTVAVLLAIVATASVLDISFALTLAAVALLYRAQPRIREIDHTLLQLEELQAPLALVADLLDGSESPPLPHGTRPFDGLVREIRFERVGVSFDRKMRPALSGVTFRIPKGRRTAIVGPSGSGKTTLVSLLLRLRMPSSGAVLVDGVPLHEIDRLQWLGNLAIAGQDVDLIDGTLRENIVLGRPEASEAEIADVVATAELGGLVAELDEGLDTWIGEYGQQVSGGQRQRIGLARALLTRPKLLILDEAMNALNDELEERIRDRLWTRDDERTMIVITHRLETLSGVDHVVILSPDGRVVGEGPPARFDLTGRSRGILSDPPQLRAQEQASS